MKNLNQMKLQQLPPVAPTVVKGVARLFKSSETFRGLKKKKKKTTGDVLLKTSQRMKPQKCLRKPDEGNSTRLLCFPVSFAQATRVEEGKHKSHISLFESGKNFRRTLLETTTTT